MKVQVYFTPVFEKKFKRYKKKLYIAYNLRQE